MNITRRGFLGFIGAALAGSALPIEFAEAKVAKAPAWAKRVVRLSCMSLAPGEYTFSCFMKVGEEMGWSRYVSKVVATGGETVIEIPYDQSGHAMSHAQLELGAPLASSFIECAPNNHVVNSKSLKPWYREFERKHY